MSSPAALTVWWLTDNPGCYGQKIAGPFDTRNDAICAQSLAEHLGHRYYLKETP